MTETKKVTDAVETARNEGVWALMGVCIKKRPVVLRR
ncbi:MAG: hypothetical protein RL186_109 [Pseudomonadota bacterium]